jgi:hypothetical protein
MTFLLMAIALMLHFDFLFRRRGHAATHRDSEISALKFHLEEGLRRMNSMFGNDSVQAAGLRPCIFLSFDKETIIGDALSSLS